MNIGILISVKPKYRKRIELTGTYGTCTLIDVSNRDEEIKKLNKYIGYSIIADRSGFILISDASIKYEESDLPSCPSGLRWRL